MWLEILTVTRHLRGGGGGSHDCARASVIIPERADPQYFTSGSFDTVEEGMCSPPKSLTHLETLTPCAYDYIKRLWCVLWQNLASEVCHLEPRTLRSQRYFHVQICSTISTVRYSLC